jgi:hypothetical protein
LTVIFARRHNARREEDGPAALAGAVIRVRDGGDRQVAGVGERRVGGGPLPVRCCARGSGPGCHPQRRDSPTLRPPARVHPWTVHAFPLVSLAPVLRARPGPGGLARPEGVPLKT